MKDFFATHCVLHKTKEERKLVRDFVRRCYPTDEFECWGDKWEPADYPYMDYDCICDEFAMFRSIPNIERADRQSVPKIVISPAEFIALFSIEEVEEGSMDAVFALV